MQVRIEILSTDREMSISQEATEYPRGEGQQRLVCQTLAAVVGRIVAAVAAGVIPIEDAIGEMVPTMAREAGCPPMTMPQHPTVVSVRNGGGLINFAANGPVLETLVNREEAVTGVRRPAPVLDPGTAEGGDSGE